MTGKGLSYPELRVLILSKLPALSITVDCQTLVEFGLGSNEMVDKYVASLGFKPLGKAWRQIDSEEAFRSLKTILYQDLAYQRPVIEEKTALFLAENFIKLFSPFQSQFFTNGSFDKKSMLGWDPITEFTFDHGVVAFDDIHIGILWAHCED